MIFTPGISSALTPDLFLRFEIPFTVYIKTRFSQTYAPSLSARYGLGFGTLFGGLNYSRTKNGSAASFTDYSGFAYVDSGFMFGSYETYGKFIGFTFGLPLSLFATVQASSYITNYEKEKIPSASLQASYGSRGDKLSTYGFDLSRVMIQDVWSLAASFNHSENRSSGLQGLVSGNEVSDYNYSRNYFLFSSTLGF